MDVFVQTLAHFGITYGQAPTQGLLCHCSGAVMVLHSVLIGV